MRRTSNKAVEYARRHNVRKWTVDADDLIEDPDVDAIYIATPPDSHADYIPELLQQESRLTPKANGANLCGMPADD